MKNTGTFFLVATPIGNLGDISARAIETLSSCDVVACEDTREMAKLFSALKIERNKREFISIHDHNESARAQTVLDFLRDDKNVAYASDAGMPAISDPGARLVDAVLDAGLTVTCIPGPSAVAAAVALSGFESTAFSFFGFFPRASKDRTAALARLNAAEHTSVFYESPQRLSSILALMATTLDESRRVVVCRELTKKFEEIFRGSAREAAEHFSGDVKGECVMVVEASKQGEDAASQALHETDVRAAMEILIASGASSRDATEALGHLSSISKNDLKAMYAEMRG